MDRRICRLIPPVLLLGCCTSAACALDLPDGPYVQARCGARSPFHEVAQDETRTVSELCTTHDGLASPRNDDEEAERIH